MDSVTRYRYAISPLQIVPGSHKMKIYNFFKNKKNLPTTLKDIKDNYTKYEKWVKNN